MTYRYREDELLPLSGIQHIAFCERQWALIHIEKQWEENKRTVEGKHLHQRVDDPEFMEARGDTLTLRAVPLSSYELGLYGVSDVVEFIGTDDQKNGVQVAGYNGYWKPYPVEYKRGKPKVDERDAVQLCAQAISLEEMLNTSIDYGYLFYGETRHREKILFTPELREVTRNLALKMHHLFANQITPRALNKKNCRLCSLVEICMPNLTAKNLSPKKYIAKQLVEILSD